MNSRDEEGSMALTRRNLLKSGVAVAATSSVSPLLLPRVAGAQGKRGGLLRVRGYDPPHFDPHQTLNFKTNNTLSFVHAKLVRHKVGAGVTPGSFIVEPDLAERWEELDDRTVVFYLRKGVRWQNRPPVNGRELIAEDVKFTYDRFLTEKANQSAQVSAGPRGSRGSRRSLYRQVPSEGALRVARQRSREPYGDLDRGARGGGEVRRSEEAGVGDWRWPLHPGALRAEREDDLPAQPGLLRL